MDLNWINDNYVVDWVDENLNTQSIDDATHILFCRDKHTDLMICQTVKLLKTRSKMSPKWFLKKLEKNQFINLAPKFSNLLTDIDANSLTVYPTSYGVGVFRFGSSEIIDQITEKLDSLGIEYRTEFSEAHYVYRFIISKKADNLSKF